VCSWLCLIRCLFAKVCEVYSLPKFQCNGAVVLTVDKNAVATDRRESSLPIYQLGKEVRRSLLYPFFLLLRDVG
jgi:hypothetical protein